MIHFSYLHQRLIEMSNLPWQGVILVYGAIHQSSRDPLALHTVWIAITTPLALFFYLLIGVFYSPRICQKTIFDISNAQSANIVLLGWFFIPVLSVIICTPRSSTHGVTYSLSTRLLCVLGILGLRAFFRDIQFHFKQSWIRLIIPITLSISLLGTATTMINMHPHESMYYTLLGGKNMKSVRFRYEMDYSGTCNRETLQKILNEDKSPSIPIYLTYVTGRVNAYLLDPKERSRSSVC